MKERDLDSSVLVHPCVILRADGQSHKKFHITTNIFGGYDIGLPLYVLEKICSGAHTIFE
jgi:hypothetical protein